MSRKANPREHPSGLTVPAQRALEHYLVHGDKAAAYREGFGRGKCSQATFEAKVKRFFNREAVVEEIRRRREAMSARTDVTVDQIVNRLRQLAFTDLPGVVEWDGQVMTVREFESLSADQRAAIESFEYSSEEMKDEEGNVLPVSQVKVKIRMKDNMAPLKMLGQHLGMFEKKVKHGLIDVPMIQLFMPGDRTS